MGRITEHHDYCFMACYEQEGDKIREECPIYRNCYSRQMHEKLSHYEDLEEQGRLITLPYEWGQFVKPKDNSVGTISAYTVVRDGVLAWVSGYKDSWCGEYLLEEIKPLTKEEAEAKLKELKEGVE